MINFLNIIWPLETKTERAIRISSREESNPEDFLSFYESGFAPAVIPGRDRILVRKWMINSEYSKVSGAWDIRSLTNSEEALIDTWMDRSEFLPSDYVPEPSILAAAINAPYDIYNNLCESLYVYKLEVMLGEREPLMQPLWDKIESINLKMRR